MIQQVGSREACYKTAEGFKFYSSRYGGCLHGQVLALLGAHQAQPDAALIAVFERGHVSEENTKKLLLSNGFKLLYASHNVEEQHAVQLRRQKDAYFISVQAHLDGLLTKVGDWEAAGFEVFPTLKYPSNTYFVFEHKSMSAAAYDMLKEAGDDIVKAQYFYENYEQYAWQISAQYWGMYNEIKNSITNLKSNNSIHNYICSILKICVSIHDRDESDRHLAFFIDKPCFTEQQCLDRCELIVTLYENAEVPKCDSRFSCGYTTNELDFAELQMSQLDLKSKRETLIKSISESEELEKYIAELEKD